MSQETATRPVLGDSRAVPLSSHEYGMGLTKIKICGLRRPDDAIVAAQAGADYLGLVFVPGRRRRLDADQAFKIVSHLRSGLQSPPTVVGLFADQPQEEVNRLASHCGLDMVQLCGDEPLEYCKGVQVPVIKVLHVPESGDRAAMVDSLARDIEFQTGEGHLVTLDRKVDGLQGGTGQSFDWEVARDLAATGNSFLLAGGLDPENVGRAVRAVRPWGVDVSSGVETEGDKDPDKMVAFAQAVRAAEKGG